MTTQEQAAGLRAVAVLVCGFLAVAVVALGTSLASAGHSPVWTVVSPGEIDVRIQRELRELAAKNHASLRFTHDLGKSSGQRPGKGELILAVNEHHSADSFLLQLKEMTAESAVKVTPKLAEEGYLLSVSYSRDSVPAVIRVEGISATGLHNGLLRLPEILVTAPSDLSTKLIPRPQALHRQRGDPGVIIADYPSFPIRGVVEGFYGKPWTYAQRLDMLRFEGQHGMNVYYYGPKDDPYHRRLWREPYPPEDMKQLGALADAARENFVDFSFAISPGLSMVYSSAAEFETLAGKLRNISELGISSFALFLDDVPQELIHPQDKAQFKTLSQAHIHLINKLYAFLKSLSRDNRLMVCPTTYTNEWGNREYIKDLGSGVNPEIPLDWTGPQVGSAEITVAQAEEWGSYLQRHPLIWDNFPGNDGRPWLLILDPVRGRDAGLPALVQGLFSNPMYQAHAAFIPLQTVADYLWNPPAYDPERSRTHAIVTQYGNDGPAVLEPLLKIYRDDAGKGPVFGTIFGERKSPIDIPAVESQISQLSSVIATLKERPGYEQLALEISPIPDLLRDQLQRILADPSFEHRPDGKITWNRERDVLKASRVSAKPVLDGDFTKWQSSPIYDLDQASQIEDGEKLWKGPAQFSARIALRWDEGNVYVGVDITDPELYQPFWSRGVQNGDAFRLIFDAEPPAGIRHGRPSEAYDLYLSPGNFADVKPSVYCEEDFLPPRPHPHDYNQEIKAVWKKTPKGFSGDIAIPISFFNGSKFGLGQEIALSFGAQKTFPSNEPLGDDVPQIIFTSKADSLFRVDPENPTTFQRLLLVEESGRQ
ncbi:MAG TPA: beta-N-acetylglucosaminidase domain-containing protein [Terriglobales bacterium]|nr:beta-N-acetylglucosaminidase domain-containing protein [Terriglobales bacterium]